MEESGSEGLEELLIAEKDGFMSGVDYVCISDNYWVDIHFHDSLDNELRMDESSVWRLVIYVSLFSFT